MKFLELLVGVELAASGARQTADNPEITDIQYDSRRVTPGSLFVAMRGETSDGNRFIDQAIAGGAVAVVTDSDREVAGIAWARVAHGRQALATLSANFYGQPAKKLGITGITGTNGKSTTAFLIEAILRAAGRTGALVGTIEYHVGGKVLPAPHTTPESLDLQRLFRETVASGGTEVVMEVSSHALVQGRTYGIPFSVAVFTNLTRDHLDYHKSMPVAEIPLKGAHNVENVLAAISTAELMGCKPDSIRTAVREFKAVEHRLQYVASIRGVEYYNDSKATNVDATIKALESFPGNIHLILGGKDKGSDYTALNNLLRERVRCVYTIGAAAEKIEKHITGATKISASGTMDRAVAQASGNAQVGDIVLLAPACASFDQFQNYEHRGRVFKELVLALPK